MLTVLNVAFPLAPVGPDEVGGAEQVVTRLDAALVRAGHRSIVVACDGSVAAGVLLPTPAAEGPVSDDVRRTAQHNHRVAIAEALRRWRVDVVHLHGLDFDSYLPPPGVPALATLHMPPAFYDPDVFRLERPDTFLHCVSRAQERSCPPDAALLPPIENGVDVDALPPDVPRGDFVLALGRVCPEKGLHLALDAACRADVPLLLAGKVFPYPEHEAYYRSEILPRLDARRRFAGPLRIEEKRRLLSAARCVVVPSLVPETSSLVTMEALACGTPVVAFPAGAVVEAVEHGVTGFLVNTVDEMADALRRVDGLDRDACRRVARERFSAHRMAERYIERYRQLAGQAAPA